MTFALLNVVMLAIALGAAGAARGARRRHSSGSPRLAWAPLVVTLAGLLVLTLVFDNLMIAADLFEYGAAHLSGVRIGAAPVEDLAYPLGAAILLPALWQLLRERGDRR